MNSDAKHAAMVHELVLANRILVAEGVLDGYGHVSVRTGPERFLLSRSLAPELVTDADILEFDLTSEPLDRKDVRTYLERFIHGEIYRARPDVQAVVHSHAPAVVSFGIVDRPLRPVYHMAGFVGEGVPVFDIRDVQRGTDMLVTSPYLGQALARTLGRSSAALMRGHGCAVTADSLPGAVGRSIYLALNARLQREAMALSMPGCEPNYLDVEEAAAAAKMMDYLRAWDVWCRQAERVLEAERAGAAPVAGRSTGSSAPPAPL